MTVYENVPRGSYQVDDSGGDLPIMNWTLLSFVDLTAVLNYWFIVLDCLRWNVVKYCVYCYNTFMFYNVKQYSKLKMIKIFFNVFFFFFGPLCGGGGGGAKAVVRRVRRWIVFIWRLCAWWMDDDGSPRSRCVRFFHTAFAEFPVHEYSSPLSSRGLSAALLYAYTWYCLHDLLPFCRPYTASRGKGTFHRARNRVFVWVMTFATFECSLTPCIVSQHFYVLFRFIFVHLFTRRVIETRMANRCKDDNFYQYRNDLYWIAINL